MRREHDPDAEIIRRLENASCPTWLPGLAEILVGADSIAAKYVGDYATGKILNGATIRFAATVSADGERPTNIEVLDRELSEEYRRTDIVLLSEDEMADRDACSMVNQSLALVSGVPTLASSVSTLVRSIHLLTAHDDLYDVSHSEPALPFSIFFSVPRIAAPASALRVVESVVHEAMHLQLTLIENHTPIIRSNERMVYSPWREELRPLRGVIHAMYVFSVISEFFAALVADAALDPAQQAFVAKRLANIKAEMLAVPDLDAIGEITSVGRLLLGKLKAVIAV